MTDAPASTTTTAAVDDLRRQIPLLAAQSAQSGGNMHYLDNAATALMPTAVLHAMRQYDDSTRGNIGRGMHRFAEQADAAYHAARSTVATALGADAQDIIFTAGATAGLNLLAQSLGDTLSSGDNVLLTLAEHHSHIVPWQRAAARRGFTLHYAAPDGAAADGAQLLQLIDTLKPRVIGVAHTTNVGGGTANLAAIAAAKPAGAQLVVDGAQHIPHAHPNLPASGADFYVFSGHKCHAPNGIGVLWGRRDALRQLSPSIGGGGAISRVGTDGHTLAPLPQRLEPGTPPISQAIALAAALQWQQTLPAAASANTPRLAQRLQDGIAAQPHARLLYPAQRGGSIVSFNIDGVHAHDVCEVFAARNIAVRGGHHCAEPLMTHLGINGCVRASIAPYNNDDDIDAAIHAADEAARLLR